MKIISGDPNAEKCKQCGSITIFTISETMVDKHYPTGLVIVKYETGYCGNDEWQTEWDEEIPVYDIARFLEDARIPDSERVKVVVDEGRQQFTTYPKEERSYSKKTRRNRGSKSVSHKQIGMGRREHHNDNAVQTEQSAECDA
jgi:hypothetical protein